MLNRHTTTFFDQIIGAVRPRLVIPVHWDSFLEPASDDLPRSAMTCRRKIDRLLARLADDGIQLGIMQGYQSIVLFADS